MIGPELLHDAPAIARYNVTAVEDVVHCVEDGTYCALLGPRLSGKTELLRFVDRTVAKALGWFCAYIDLYTMRSTTLQQFFTDLTGLIVGHVSELAHQAPPPLEYTVASSAAFRSFLSDTVTWLEHDLVLIIEHLEAIPTDLVQALLTSLRAAYMDQQTLDHRLTVVVSGALSLATLTVGESSPFRGIARRIFVGDLTESQSAELIAEQFSEGGVSHSSKAARNLLRATNGDPYLIRRMCQLCAEATQATSEVRLTAAMVRRVTRHFLKHEVYGYAPLQEAVRLLEDDPDLLRCILLLLAHGTVPRADLPLPLSPDVDPLYLTGVVEQVNGRIYRIQNRIYHRFLAGHFHPGRVGHVLAMAGHWDSALDYLEAGIQEGNEQARSDLLSATIHSMYASEDVGRAAHFLARGLSTAFGVVEARVWYAPPQEDRLRMVGHLGPQASGAAWSSPEMPLMADRLEARAFRQVRALRGQEGARHVWRAIPLAVAEGKPVGVVTLCDDVVGGRFLEQRERELQLVGYLNQAARALHAVTRRRHELTLAGRMQVSLLPTVLPELSGWQLAAALRPARETSGDYYDFIRLPGERLGVVIADVTDKGMGAALYMALSRTLIRTYAADYPDRPDLTLRAASERMLRDTAAGLFVTAFYGILDPEAGTLTYCNAGHPPPFLLSPHANGECVPLPGRGMALGVVEGVDWGHTVLEINPGNAILLYTDGIPDAQNPTKERYGVAEMLDAAKAELHSSAQQLQAAVLERVQQFVGNEPQVDDITLMVIKRES